MIRMGQQQAVAAGLGHTEATALSRGRLQVVQGELQHNSSYTAQI